MKKLFNTMVRPIIRRFGIDVVRYRKSNFQTSTYSTNFSEQNIAIYDAVKSYTLTSLERVNALIEAVRYVVENRIDGAMVECGVWRGGSAMAVALTLKELGDCSREIYLYDTFSGMSAPTDADISFYGDKASETFLKTKISQSSSKWCFSPLEEVKENLFKTGYPREKFHFIEGKVEDTIPANIPGEIALLRLDTDWYESTKHELNHLFPLLKQYGVLILDDYGHWEGSRRATDEYIAEKNLRIFLSRIDYTGRIAIKT